MSAWICPDDMIELITSAEALRQVELGNMLDNTQPQALFDDLRQTNYDSVNARYDEDEEPAQHAVELVAEVVALLPHHLLQIRLTLASYRYQSGEHEGWATSEAYKLYVNLGEWVDAKLVAMDWPRVPRQDSRGGDEWKGLNDASWEWTRERGFKVIFK